MPSIQWWGMKRCLIVSYAVLLASGCASAPTLHDAVRHDNVDLANKLLSEGRNVDEPDKEGATPLTAAIVRGRTQLATLLVARGADVNRRQKKNLETPLTLVAASGDVEMIKLFTDRGAQIEAATEGGDTPLALAARAPIHVADEAVALLLGKGAQVDVPNKLGNRPLHGAVERGNAAVVKRLLAHGAQAAARNAAGDSPLTLACGVEPARYNAEIPALLLSHGAPVNPANNRAETPLTLAASKGRAELVGLLVERSADLKQRDGAGNTALAAAAGGGHADVVKVLLPHRAVVENEAQRGRTALMAAAGAGHIGIIELLRADGAKLEAKDDRGKTPLFYAAEGGYQDIVARLLQSGALQDATDDDGNTPLHEPANLGRTEIVQMLLVRGTAADTSNKGGRTPLMLAAANGHAEIVKLLLDAGADARAGADNALVWTAAVAGYRDVVAHLINAGAEPVATNRTDPEALFASGMTFELAAQRQAFLNRHDTAAAHFKRAASFYEKTAQIHKERADSMATRKLLGELGRTLLLALGDVASQMQARQQSRSFNEIAALGRASRERTGYQGYVREFERLQRSSATTTAASQYHWSAADAQRSFRTGNSGAQTRDAAGEAGLEANRKAESANRGLAKLCTDLAACYETGGDAPAIRKCVEDVDDRHRSGSATTPPR